MGSGKFFGIFLILILSITFVSGSSNGVKISDAVEDGFGVSMKKVSTSINYTINGTSNSTEYWNTNIGTLNNTNSTQFDNGDGSTLNILESWLNSLYVKKSGDNMTGTLNTTRLIVDDRIGIGIIPQINGIDMLNNIRGSNNVLDNITKSFGIFTRQYDVDEGDIVMIYGSGTPSSNLVEIGGHTGYDAMTNISFVVSSVKGNSGSEIGNINASGDWKLSKSMFVLGKGYFSQINTTKLFASDVSINNTIYQYVNAGGDYGWILSNPDGTSTMETYLDGGGWIGTTTDTPFTIYQSGATRQVFNEGGEIWIPAKTIHTGVLAINTSASTGWSGQFRWEDNDGNPEHIWYENLDDNKRLSLKVSYGSSGVNDGLYIDAGNITMRPRNIYLGIYSDEYSDTNGNMNSIYFGNTGYLASLSTEGTYLSSNIRNVAGGGWKYMANNYASLYHQTVGVHQWYSTQTSGTAGASATLKNTLTLAKSGDMSLREGNLTLDKGGINTAGVGYFGSNVSDISIYATKNISATGYITRTEVFDKSEDVWNYIVDSDELINLDGSINHDKFYGKVNYKITDWDNPILEGYDENCGILENEKGINVSVCTKTPIYSYPEKEEEGVDLVKEIELLRQGVFELKQENDLLKNEICKLNPLSEVCK